MSLVGELWHQIVKHPNKQLINKLRDTSYHAEIWYTFESTNTMFTLKPLKNFSKKISSAFSLPNRTCDRITPTIHRETETNESDLFVYNFERYGNRSFLQFLIYGGYYNYKILSIFYVSKYFIIKFSIFN